jgi:outer membrane protein TolC
LIGLAGCSVAPQPLKDDEVRQRVADDQLQLYADQEPIAGPLTFADALARALKYNLDYRLKLMESALASGLHDVSSYDMLPKMLVSAGYASRSNDSGGTSVGIETHSVSLIPSSSVERNRSLANAAFSWNLLDFGVSYYRAKQSADQYLIAEERRRRVMQTVLQDLRTSYWRALGAQRLERQADELLVRVHIALGKSREAEIQGLLPPAQALAYQGALLDATTLLNARRQDLEFAKRELSALMSVPPGTRFTLAQESEPSLPPMPNDIRKLEDIALQARPELREEDYRKRISADEARRQLLALLPSMGLDFNAQYDSNSYLYNNNWVDSGVQVSANLFKLAAIPATRRASESQGKTDNARRLALSMAVLTQVRIAVERYKLALVDYDLADQSSEVDQRMAKFARASLTSRTDSELEVIRTETRALLAQFQRYSKTSAATATCKTCHGNWKKASVTRNARPSTQPLATCRRSSRCRSAWNMPATPKWSKACAKGCDRRSSATCSCSQNNNDRHNRPARRWSCSFASAQCRTASVVANGASVSNARTAVKSATATTKAPCVHNQTTLP